MITCPKCKSRSNHRMKRKKRIRLLIGTKAFACDDCNATYTWVSWLQKSFSIG